VNESKVFLFLLWHALVPPVGRMDRVWLAGGSDTFFSMGMNIIQLDDLMGLKMVFLKEAKNEFEWGGVGAMDNRL